MASIAVLGIDHFTGEALSKQIPRLVFHGEAAGLIAFGISWLTASRTLPGLTNEQERFHLLAGSKPI